MDDAAGEEKRERRGRREGSCEPKERMDLSASVDMTTGGHHQLQHNTRPSGRVTLATLSLYEASNHRRVMVSKFKTMPASRSCLLDSLCKLSLPLNPRAVVVGTRHYEWRFVTRQTCSANTQEREGEARQGEKTNP